MSIAPILIQAETVSREYRLGEAVICAVNGVSLTVQRGEFLALLGSSGSGKSTLLNLLAGLDRPTSGAIRVQDRNLSELDAEELARYRRETVGMVFQSFNLLPRMTLEENVELPLRLAEVDRNERESRVGEALERVRLGPRRQPWPRGLPIASRCFPMAGSSARGRRNEGARPDGTGGAQSARGSASQFFDDLQIEFAKELTDQPATLVGKDLVLRYAERAALSKESGGNGSFLEGMMGASMPGGISIVPREKTLRIVGVIESDPSAGIGGFGGARVFLPFETAEHLHVAQPDDLQTFLSGDPAKPSYMALTVRVRAPKDVPQVEAAIKQLGFSTFSLLDATKGLRLVFTVFDLFLGLFGSLALTVASLGIINTLVMAILERRREIGILKALGATDRDVRSLFFAEAGAMGLFGGIFGVTLGWLIGKALTWGTTIYLHRQDLPGVRISYVPWWLALGAILFAIAVSLIAGLYPAARAARLNPVEALRYE